jgi:hypothetical protein
MRSASHRCGIPLFVDFYAESALQITGDGRMHSEVSGDLEYGIATFDGHVSHILILH